MKIYTVPPRNRILKIIGRLQEIINRVIEDLCWWVREGVTTTPKTINASLYLYCLSLQPVHLLKFLVQIEGRVFPEHLDTDAQRSILSIDAVCKYIYYMSPQSSESKFVNREVSEMPDFSDTSRLLVGHGLFNYDRDGGF